MLHYVKPSKRPWYVNIALAVIYLAVIFTVFKWYEKKINPANFDLGMQQQIQETQQLTKDNLERTGKVEPSAK